MLSKVYEKLNVHVSIYLGFYSLKLHQIILYTDLCDVFLGTDFTWMKCPSER